MTSKRRPSSTRSKEGKLDRGNGEKGKDRLPKNRAFRRVLSSLARRTSGDADSGAVLADTSWNTSDDTVLATNRSFQDKFQMKAKSRWSKHMSERQMVVLSSDSKKNGKPSKAEACFFTFSKEDIKYQQFRARAKKKESKRQQNFSDSRNRELISHLGQAPRREEVTRTEYQETCKEPQGSHPVHPRIENEENIDIANAEKTLTEDHVVRDPSLQSKKMDDQSDNLPVATATITFVKFMTCCPGLEDIPEASDQSGIAMLPQEI